MTNKCDSGTRGTDTYQPLKSRWRDGFPLWDYYALACIVIECDMERDAYFRLKTEEDAKAAIQKHVGNKGSCEHLFTLADRLVLNYKGYDEDPTIEELEDMIKQIKFRAQK